MYWILWYILQYCKFCTFCVITHWFCITNLGFCMLRDALSVVCYFVWCVLFCVMCYCIVLYFTLLYCPVLHCSTLPPGINPFAVNNNDNIYVKPLICLLCNGVWTLQCSFPCHVFHTSTFCNKNTIFSFSPICPPSTSPFPDITKSQGQQLVPKIVKNAVKVHLYSTVGRRQAVVASCALLCKHSHE